MSCSHGKLSSVKIGEKVRSPTDLLRNVAHAGKNRSKDSSFSVCTENCTLETKQWCGYYQNIQWWWLLLLLLMLTLARYGRLRRKRTRSGMRSLASWAFEVLSINGGKSSQESAVIPGCGESWHSSTQLRFVFTQLSKRTLFFIRYRDNGLGPSISGSASDTSAVFIRINSHPDDQKR